MRKKGKRGKKILCLQRNFQILVCSMRRQQDMCLLPRCESFSLNKYPFSLSSSLLFLHLLNYPPILPPFLSPCDYKELMMSKSLKELLHIILLTGNFINGVRHAPHITKLNPFLSVNTGHKETPLKTLFVCLVL